jgi:multicomponent Na+:H+ antiporter subunit G
VSALDVVSAVFMLTAVAFVLLGALGLQRFDDVFMRIHAATKPMTLGVVLVAAGAALQMERTSDVVKLALAVILQLVSAPVAAHMIPR